MLLFGGIRGWKGIFSDRAKQLITQLTTNNAPCEKMNCLDEAYLHFTYFHFPQKGELEKYLRRQLLENFIENFSNVFFAL